MERKKKQMSMPMAAGILIVVVSMVLACIKTGVGIVVPLFLSWFLMFLVCKLKGYDFDQVFGVGLDAMRKAGGAMMIMIAVGLLVGVMISSGTIPAFIYYGLMVINPQIFLLCAVVVTALMALVTGTSYGSAASAGIAMMGIGTAMGIPTGMVGAAVITGALLGDKLSPLSDVPNLCSALVDGDLFKNIRYNLWTSVIPFVISCIIFLIMGMSFGGSAYDRSAVDQVMTTLAENFRISWVAMIPVAAVIALLVLKVPSVPAIMGGALVSAAVACFYQGMNGAAVFSSMYSGYAINTGVEVVDNLLNRGGLISMAQSIFILISAVTLGGMLDEVGVINAFLDPIIPKLNSVSKIIGATLLTNCFINMVGSAAWLSNILTAQLMGPIFKKEGLEPELLSRTMEDGYVFGTIIFPWHAMTIYFTGVLGCTWASYMPYMFFSYLVPVFTMVCAFTGLGMYQKGKSAGQKGAV